MHKAKRFINPNAYLLDVMVICEVVYLCVIQESDSSVTWPERNISQPACAIIAPLSIQKLKARYHMKRFTTMTLTQCNENKLSSSFSSDIPKEGDPFSPLIRGKDSSTSLLTHDPHHLLQTQVTYKRACIQMLTKLQRRDPILQWD